MAALEDIGLRVRVEELEREVEELHGRIAELERTVADIVALGQDFWREEAAVLLIGAGVKSWHYDVRDRNMLFSDVFPCESVDGGRHAKRWVGKSGELATTVAINRAEPLLFTIAVEGFVNKELARSFKLEVDGEPVPWSSHENKTWSARIPAHPGRARLDFRLSVDTALVPPGKDVTFSFAEIRLAPPVAADTEDGVQLSVVASSAPAGVAAVGVRGSASAHTERAEPEATLRETA